MSSPVSSVAGSDSSAPSVETIRRQFPALERVHAGHPVAYFDGPGGTQVPRQVVDAIADYLLHHNANTHWQYPTSHETDAAIAGARAAFAGFLNASPDEIVFGANMTTLTLHLGRGLARAWGPGDEIVVTELDHHANSDTWRALASERGVTIRTVRMQPGAGQIDWTDLEDALGPRTRLLAIGAASNALGTITDVRAAAAMAHEAGALVFVDAVHYAPHALVDVKVLDCDFLACSAYKFYGPHLGVLYGRADTLQSVDLPRLEPATDRIPDGAETGTQNHEGIVGAGTAVDFLAGLAPGPSRRDALRAAFGRLHASGEALVARLWDGLARVPSVTLYGPPPTAARTPTLAFTVGSRPSDQIALALAERGVFVSHGDFYATTVIRRLGLAEQGLVRAGCVCYTTVDEVDRLVEGVREIIAR